MTSVAKHVTDVTGGILMDTQLDFLYITGKIREHLVLPKPRRFRYAPPRYTMFLGFQIQYAPTPNGPWQDKPNTYTRHRKGAGTAWSPPHQFMQVL